MQLWLAHRPTKVLVWTLFHLDFHLHLVAGNVGYGDRYNEKLAGTHRQKSGHLQHHSMDQLEMN